MYNSMIGSGFIPLEELATRSTMALARSLKIDLKPPDAAGVLPLLGELDVYPDIFPGLQKMRDLGIIRSAQADPDYTARPEPADTVAVLRALA
jgi:hypothetical protein